jgi:hypothetical protein
MSFISDTLTELRLEIPSEIQQRAWQQSQESIHATGQWNIYLNQVSLQTFLPWLRAEYAPEAEVEASMGSSLWDLVSGTAIRLGDKRLILLPSKTLDTSELRVPQEWVDIPDWAGDYYLAVQVDPDESELRVWGYTTHEQLKQMGEYEAGDRIYSLDAQSLVQDMSVLWVVRQLYPDEPTQAAIAPLSPLTASQAENWLLQLSSPDVLQPRLAMSFSEWGAFLANHNLRQRLHQLRQNQALQNQAGQNRAQNHPTQQTANPAGLVSAPISRGIVNLGQWLQNCFEESWETLETLFGNEPEMAVNLRDVNEATIKRAKLLNLPEQVVILLITVEPEPDDRIAIRVQLRSSDRQICLPPNLTLTLLTPEGNLIQSVQTREQDDAIQLKRFKCPADTQFILHIDVDNTRLVEEFRV